MECIYLQELLHRQDIVERSHKQQMMKEIKKRKILTHQQQQAEDKIKEIEKTLHVIIYIKTF